MRFASVLQQQAAGGATTPTYVGLSQAAVSSGTTDITVTPPSASSGDLLVVVMLFDDLTGTVTTPTGWTQQWVSDGTRLNGYVFTRAHDGSGSYAFARSASTAQGAYSCYAFSGAAYDTEVESGGFSNTPSGASVTPSAEAYMVLAWMANANDGNASAPTGYTEMGVTSNSSCYGEWYRSTSTVPASATGTVTSSSTFLGSRTWKSVHCSIIGA